MFGRVEGGGMRLAAGGRLQLRKPPKCAECGRGVEGGPLTGAGCWLPPPYCDKICTITPTLHITRLSQSCNWRGQAQKMQIINMIYLHDYINILHQPYHCIGECHTLTVTNTEKWPLKLQRCIQHVA